MSAVAYKGRATEVTADEEAIETLRGHCGGRILYRRCALYWHGTLAHDEGVPKNHPPTVSGGSLHTIFSAGFRFCLPLHIGGGVLTSALQRNNMIDNVTGAGAYRLSRRGARVCCLELAAGCGVSPDATARRSFARVAVIGGVAMPVAWAVALVAHLTSWLAAIGIAVSFWNISQAYESGECEKCRSPIRNKSECITRVVVHFAGHGNWLNWLQKQYTKGVPDWRGVGNKRAFRMWTNTSKMTAARKMQNQDYPFPPARGAAAQQKTNKQVENPNHSHKTIAKAAPRLASHPPLTSSTPSLSPAQHPPGACSSTNGPRPPDPSDTSSARSNKPAPPRTPDRRASPPAMPHTAPGP